MIEIVGNMFDSKLLEDIKPNAICITTNGFVKNNGRAVMGAGNAKYARDKFGDIDLWLGVLLNRNGNIVQHIYSFNTDSGRKINVLAFPVKHHWQDKADIDLIKRSCEQLNNTIITSMYLRVILPRPGCENGKLNWQTEVKPIIEKHLDSRVYIIRRN